MENGYYEARQHLNLSQRAFEIVQNDMLCFMAKPSLSGMLNRIFTVFREDSCAATEVRAELYRRKLAEELVQIPESPVKEDILRTLSEVYRQRCVEKVNSYPREHSFKFQLDRENYAFMQSWQDERGEFQCSASRYIKAVIEEYAGKSYYEREGILLRELMEQLESYASMGKLLRITLRSSNLSQSYEVKPWGILSDPNCSFHYLVGFSRPMGSDESEKPASFRISRIEKVTTTNVRSGRITAAQQADLNRHIQQVGVPFLLQEPEIIRVRFTPEGKQAYENQTHLRPACSRWVRGELGEWEGEFQCTPLQASYFFFKYGAEAEILAPKDLRQEFLQRYKKALHIYEKGDSIE